MAEPGCDVQGIITKAGQDCLQRHLNDVGRGVQKQMVTTGRNKQEIINEMVIMLAAKERVDSDHMEARSEMGIGIGAPQ